MKKVLVFMLCFLAVFAIVSCKQDPKEPEKKDDAYVLTVRPAVENPDDPESTITWGKQTGKYQFTLTQPIVAGESIEFLAKVASDITEIIVRDGSTNPYPKWATLAVSSLEKTDDGWLIVSIEGDKVTSTADLIGLTFTTPQNASLFVSIKDLKIDGEAVDFEEIDPNAFATAFAGALCPTRVSAVVSKEN